MKILLINPPGKTSFVTPPLSLMYLAASLRNVGHQPQILDFLLEKPDQDSFFRIINQGVEMIAISAVTPLIDNAISLANFIKQKLPEKIIVFGGPHPTLLARETLENCPSIDFIVKGEGEERFNALLDYLEGEKKEEELDGIAFRRDGEIIDLPQKKYIENLDDLPLPARDLVPIERYSEILESEEKPATTLITSRGCPFHCIYCSKPIFGKIFRARSPENILKEIEFLKEKYKIREIIFYDDIFTFNRERIIRLCQLMVEKKLNIIWKCETRVNFVDDELLQMMKKAGCYLIGYGIESGSQRVLNILKKGITIEGIEKAIEMTKKAGIGVLGYFMMGIPGETEREIKETINFAKSLDVDFALFSIATPYPGTELYQIAQSLGKIPKSWENSFYTLGSSESIISLCDLDSEILRKYQKIAYRSFYFRPIYIRKKLLKLKSPKTLKRYLRGVKILLKI